VGSKRAVVGAVCSIVLAGIATGCSATGDPGDTGEARRAAGTQQSDPSAATPTGQPTPTGTVSRPADPVLKSYQPVLRGGKKPRPSVSADPEPFDRAIRYSDGLRLVVTGIAQGKVTGQGPGVFLGEPKTEIGLRMTNRGNRAVRLDQVVVTVVYGSQRRTSRPVYDERARDFSGVLRPGSSADASYLFSVPRDQLDDVTMLVDFDGRHTVARFRGAARTEP
jgi:hypothetical protein